MITDDAVVGLRGLMFLEGTFVGLMFAWILGEKWHAHHWPFRISGLGIFVLIGYVSAVQVKAYQRQIPFDAFSVVGLVALSVTVVALALYIKTRPTDGT